MERDLVVKFVEALRLNDIGAVLICDKKYGLVNFFDSSGSYKHYDVSVAVSQVSDRNMLLTLITSGYNVNGREYDNSTIFSRVIESEDLELIKLCLNNGGNIYHKQHPQDVLFKIISTGNKDIIESCLKSEQDKAKLLPLVNRALQYIFYIEQVPNIASDTWLADIASDTWSADYQKKFLDITKLLLAHGANIDVTYQFYDDLEHKYLEYTVLIDACTRGNVALVRALIIDCGADINRVTADTGPLHAAINSLMKDVVRYLLDQPNIDFNQQILSTLDSPLHVASRKGDVRFIELLLDKGANKCIYNLMGQYPCDVAHESVGKYFHKILAVDSLVSVEEKLIIYEHKLTQSLENRLPQFDLKITELIGKLEGKVIQMQSNINEMSEKLQENEKKMLDLELQQTRLTSRMKRREVLRSQSRCQKEASIKS